MNKWFAGFVAIACLVFVPAVNAQQLGFSFDGGLGVSARIAIPFSDATINYGYNANDQGGVSSNFSISGENLKVLPKNEVKKIDAHEFKDDFVGGSVSKYDIYWDTSEPDKDKRKIKLVKKSDTSVIVDTGYTWGDVKKRLSRRQEKQRSTYCVVVGCHAERNVSLGKVVSPVGLFKMMFFGMYPKWRQLLSESG